MNGAIFKETVRQTWLQALIWGVCFGFIGLSTLAVIPDAEGMQAMADLIEQLPSFMVQLIGSGNDFVFMSTPEGFITAGFYGRLLLLLSPFPVLLGLRVTSQEENSGVMDTLLSLPVSRSQMMIEKIVAYLLMIVLMVLALNLTVISGNSMFDTTIDSMKLMVVGLALSPSVMFIFGLTVLLTAIIRQRRTAIIAVVAVILGGFVIDMVTGIATGTFLENAKLFSVHHYYNSAVIFQQGVVWAHVWVMLGLTLIALVGGIVAFNRRDLS